MSKPDHNYNYTAGKLRFPLWLLLASVVPFAFLSKYLGDQPDIVYSESRSDIVTSSDTILGFQKDQFGSPIEDCQDVSSVYASLGVSFANGLPDHFPSVINASPKFEVPVIGLEKQSGISSFVEKPLDLEERKSLGIVNWKRVEKSKYWMRRIPETLSGETICPVSYQKIPRRKEYPTLNPRRFVGLTTVYFHQPSSPQQLEGVQQVGFFAATLQVPNTLEVRCFSPTGEFLARQRNISTGTVFMGFKTRREIGWIEIESVGEDKDYAIGNLSFGN